MPSLPSIVREGAAAHTQEEEQLRRFALEDAEAEKEALEEERIPLPRVASYAQLSDANPLAFPRIEEEDWRQETRLVEEECAEDEWWAENRER